MGSPTKQLVLAWLAAGIFGVTPSIAVSQLDPSIPDQDLADLAVEFEAWLSVNQPVSGSAFLRVERPTDWKPDWSQSALLQRKSEYRLLQSRQRSLNTLGFDTADRVDQVLLGASMERIHWQLEVLDSPSRDPGFYLDQTLGSVHAILIENPEPDEASTEALIQRLMSFPMHFNSARLVLDQTVPELAEAAVARLADAGTTVLQLDESLRPFVATGQVERFELGIRAARQSLESFRDWLVASHPRFVESAAIGEPRLRWFLGRVALIPRSAESLLTETESTLARVGAQLALVKQRFARATSNSPFDGVNRLIQMSGISQDEISTYIETNGLVTMTGEPPVLELAELPVTLLAISDAGAPLFFPKTGESPGKRYLHSEYHSENIIEASAWSDPRLLLTWSGSPGLYLQFVRASQHPRIIRRQPAASTQSTGLALYFQEQLTQSGLYSLKPSSYQLALGIIAYWSALAHADIQLALGQWESGDAVQFLVESVERPAPDALSDVRRLLAHPGAASAEFATYSQAVRFLADALRQLGEAFSLQDFNDRLLMNAHVPIALQRWEYLDLDDELDQLLEQRGRPATVPE